MKTEIIGLDILNSVLRKMPNEVNRLSEKALKEVSLDLQGKSQRLAPVDLGDLRGSAYTEVKGLNAEIGFSEPYALRQHEEVGYNHPGGGEAKYLETPYKNNLNKYIQHISKAIKKAVE